MEVEWVCAMRRLPARNDQSHARGPVPSRSSRVAGYVTPDVKDVAYDVLRRPGTFIVSYEAEAKNITSENVIRASWKVCLSPNRAAAHRAQRYDFRTN